MRFKITPIEIKLDPVESMIERICRDDIQKELNGYLANELDSEDNILGNDCLAYARHVLKLNGFKQKPASQFVRSIINKLKNANKPCKEWILERALSHQEVIQRDKSDLPLKDLEKRGLTSLVRNIYGGHVHTKDKQRVFDKIKAIGKKVYEQAKFQNIRLGSLLTVLKTLTELQDLTFTNGTKTFPVSRTTFGEILKNITPKAAKSYGYNSELEKTELKKFIKKMAV